MGLEENLISAVFLRPFIYDKLDPNHSRRGVLQKAWEEIAEKVGENSTDASCRSRWKNLKDTFYKNNKKKPSGSGGENGQPTWPWFESMAFLLNSNKPQKTSGNDEESIEEESLQTLFENESSVQEMGEVVIQTFVPESVPSTSKLSGTSTDIKLTSETKEMTLRGSSNSKLLQNGGSSKRRGKESLATQWGKVLEKFIDVADGTKDMQEETTASTFADFIKSEMKEMSSSEQDEFKFAVMDSLKIIKRSRIQS